MKTRYLPLLFAPLLLCGCSKAAYQADPNALLGNPLYVELFANEMVDTMVEFDIQNDPIILDTTKKKIIDDTKKAWLIKSTEAKQLQRKGIKGSFIEIKEYAEGEVLLLNNIVHFGPNFVTAPGPELHAFLSTVVDPRDAETFPDATAIDVGIVRVPYGAQSFIITQKIDDPKIYRSIALWDVKLGLLYGFAQINPMN